MRQIPKWNYFSVFSAGQDRDLHRSGDNGDSSVRIPARFLGFVDQVMTARMDAARPFAAVLGCRAVRVPGRVSAVLEDIA